MGNRLQGRYYGYTEARKNLPEKTPLGSYLVKTKYGISALFTYLIVRNTIFSLHYTTNNTVVYTK